jgi:hypothetical protein
MANDPQRRQWGRALQRALEPMPLADRAEFLQHLEAKYRATADFEVLREIQEYKKLVSSPTSTPAPETD